MTDSTADRHTSIAEDEWRRHFIVHSGSCDSCLMALAQERAQLAQVTAERDAARRSAELSSNLARLNNSNLQKALASADRGQQTVNDALEREMLAESRVDRFDDELTELRYMLAQVTAERDRGAGWLVELEDERDAAVADNAALVEALSDVLMGENHMRAEDTLRDRGTAGAAMLAELEALRRVANWAERSRYIWHDDGHDAFSEFRELRDALAALREVKGT